jgi:DNA-binding NtrC family response regulator
MRLLVIGQKSGELEVAASMAAAAGARVTHAESGEAGLAALRAMGADLVMMDVTLKVPAFIAHARSERFSVDVVACGITNDPKAAAAAIEAGAKEYVPLPPDAEMIAAIIQNVTADNNDLVYRDMAMVRCMGLVDAVAQSDASILITGRSGTGKEVVARSIHKRSARAAEPFVAVNCAAIPESLLESELFGHEKGAFTGAVARRIGKFEEASGGTLLLDEISEMDVRLQAKLLRAIQERQITRVGGTGSVDVNIRILATSNRNLAEAVKDGTFREDLYYRLNVVEVTLPALKDRPKDIDILARHFVSKFTDANDLPPKNVSDAALAALRSHDWPGNVRELENMMQRAVLLSGTGDIGVDEIVLSNGARVCRNSREISFQQPTSGGEAIGAVVGQSMDEIERAAILATLANQQGNRQHAAQILGISIRTMRTKLKTYSEQGIHVPRKGSEALAMGA